MGILRVKRDSPYLSQNNDYMSTKNQYHALLSFDVFGRYTTNCYLNAQNGVRRTAERQLSHIARVSPKQILGIMVSVQVRSGALPIVKPSVPHNQFTN